MISIDLKVHLVRDDESGRWYIGDSDIPGLRLEAESADALMQLVMEFAPQLIELNRDEIIASHTSTDATTLPRRPRPVSILPVFDSPLSHAYA